jgi:Abnormal spindle-like microcephaly-assoc'd, ASPM-SPD-2-Hydin/PQQ-like domain
MSLAGTTRAAMALTVVAATLTGLGVTETPAGADVHTVSQDALRTGWDAAEPSLSPGTVTGSNFGQIFSTAVQGQVYAQPLVIGSTVVVGTEDNYVYGLDAVNGAVRWQRSLGPAWPTSIIGCADLTPNMGITATGVYDPATDYVYLSTKVNDGPDQENPNWYLHAVSPTTGAERPGWPVKIVGTPANDPAHPFATRQINNRPGLLLLGGVVYLAFGSICDYGSYVGLVAGVNVSTQAINMWSDEVGATSQRGGIWHAGGGLVSDGPGRILLSTGNGTTAPDGPGANPPQQLSESVVRLNVASNGAISAADFFSPSNAATLDHNDTDLGSGGPVALPSPYFGTPSLPHLMVEIGKDGRLFLLNRDNLGGKNQKPGGGDNVIQTLGPFKGVWGHPAVYGGEGGYVYVVQNQSTMLAFKYGVDGAGRPAFSLAGNTSESFGYTSGSPIVTSNGTSAGSAVVWVNNVDGPNGSNGRLCAYHAIPVNNHLNLLRCFPIGTGTKFSKAASSNGRVYVGTRDGRVLGFGQPTTAALRFTQTDFGSVDVSGTKTATVTATATRPITVNSISTSGAPFTVAGASTPALPASLGTGGTITVPVTFAPTMPGAVTGTLSFSITEAGVAQTLGAALNGNAIKPGLTPTPATLDFGQVPVGATKSLTVSLTNTGPTDETISSSTAPSAPYTATGMPAAGSVLAPGQSVSVSITYAPTAAGDNPAALTVTSTSNVERTVSVPLAGTGVVGVAQLEISPSSLDFGTVPVGESVTKTLTVSNSGNLNVTVTKAAPPALPYVVNTPLPEGLVLTPEDVLQVQVTFAPTAAGSFNNLYVISSDDGHGAHEIPVTGTASPQTGTPLPPISQGGWMFNGSAQLSGSSVVLTQATAKQAGSAVWSTPLPSDGLRANFTATIGGGTGADGMTFAMLAADNNTGKSLGLGGGGMGYGGLAGIAVALDTYKGAGEPSNNFLGVATSGAASSLTYVATTTNIPNLRSGQHAVSVLVTGNTVTVLLDGIQRLAANVAMPASVLPAFTAGTGGSTDQHVAGNVSITSGTTTLPTPGSGWRFNGATTVSGSRVVLTPAQAGLAGTALYSDPVATDQLSASFTLSMNGGTGADGAAFVLLDPAQATATSVGKTGGGLGFAGLAGVAVSFLTYPQAGINSKNYVGIETSTAGGAASFVASTTNVPDLRSGTHAARVTVSGKTVSLTVDGRQVLSAQVPSLQLTAIVGFSAGTGGSTDVHMVSDVGIRTNATAMSAPYGNGWTRKGSTTVNGQTVQLTPAAASRVGTAVCDTPVATARLKANFTLQIGGGTGADGLTFMLLDRAKSTSASIGGAGGGLGFAGLSGVAVTFVTYQKNLMGITMGGSPLTYVTTSTSIPNLRAGTHQVDIAVSGKNLVVTLDGTQVFNTAVTIPANAYVGFSAGTGSLTDVHAVSRVHIAY